MIRVAFEGIDAFNRAVFKDMDSEARYGCLDVLFPRTGKISDIIKTVKPSMFVLLGYSFGCEAYGDTPKDQIQILIDTPKHEVSKTWTNDTKPFCAATSVRIEVKQVGSSWFQRHLFDEIPYVMPASDEDGWIPSIRWTDDHLKKNGFRRVEKSTGGVL